MFVRQGLVLALGGILLGLVSAFALSRWISSLLFGVGNLDPVTYAFSVGALAAAALAASYVPAQRAASVDPATTLRGE